MIYRSVLLAMTIATMSSAIVTDIWAQTTNDPGKAAPGVNQILLEADQDTPTPGVSPARRINRDSLLKPKVRSLDDGFRSIDGSGNNFTDRDMGASNTTLLRLVPSDYWDGVEDLAGQNRRNPREISNIMCAQKKSFPNTMNASDFLWQWGQFLDHDIDLTDGVDPPEPADIVVPLGDPYFDPKGTGRKTISFNRSIYDPTSGTGPRNPRQQLNEVTAWIDASNVYGSDSARALALRTNDGTGRLKTSSGNLLPFNTDGLANAGGDSDALFLAGDVRANEQIGLAAMHTLFVREHNRLAKHIATQHPGIGGNEIYQRARRIVGAEMQVITYQEYLPVLLGPNALAPYRGYRQDVEASIANVFSTALYRYGHSTLGSRILRLDAKGKEIKAGHLALRDAFFSPKHITNEGGIAPILRGLAAQACQEIDPYIIDEVRNFLFGPPNAGGLDLASLNIQRGRDHGLPSYNDVREALRLNRVETFADITTNREVQAHLASAYQSVDDIDVWVGGLAEDHLPQAMVGKLIFVILKKQFEALRDGDRFWYSLTLNPKDIAYVEQTRLADVIRRNTHIGGEISDNVFYVHRPGTRNSRVN